MVHPKRMTKKIINCLTNLGSIGPPRFILKIGEAFELGHLKFGV